MSNSLKKAFGDNSELDKKSLNSLVGALERANMPGFDYLEFKQSLSALREMGMDEATAMKSAFATASTVGLTKDKLVKTAKHYKQVLNNELKEFEQAVKKQVEQRVDSKKMEVDILKRQVEEYAKKIKSLENEIKKHQNTIDHADDNIKTALEKINGAKENFGLTFQKVLSEIDKDIEQISSRL